MPDKTMIPADFLIQGAAALHTGEAGDEAVRTTGTDVRVRAGRIAAIGTLMPEPGEAVVDARHAVLYPGWVNTHHHLFQSVLKNIVAGQGVPLEPWLEAVPYHYGPLIDREALTVAATLGMAELLLSGCTTVGDHHYLFGPGMDHDPAQVLFDTAENLGARFVLLRGGATLQRAASKGPLPLPCETLDAMLDTVHNTVSRYHQTGGDALRKVVMAPTTPFYSTTPDELRTLARAARSWGIGLHSHLSETAHYVHFAAERWGMRPVQWCAEQEWIGPDVSYAHMVHLDASEVALCGQTGTAIAHCPQSNGRLGSGIAPVQALHAAGAVVSVGVDGAASNEAADMVNELHAAWLIHRAAKGADAQTAAQLVHWATDGGARALGLNEVGRIAPGMQADLALYDLNHPRYAGHHELASAPITAGGGAHLRRVWVAGREVVRDGAIPGLDLPHWLARARAVVERLQQRAGLRA
jgi:cytosine/adenosine deaminase-related metal-dependent hydrolase